MSRRLYFVLPDVAVAHQVDRELLLARVESRHMHFMAKEGTDLGDLPEATMVQKSDIVHGMEIGLVTGGSAGFIAGIAAVLFFGVAPVAGAVIALLAIFGSIFGIWVAGLIGSSIPNTRLKAFEKDLVDGHVLLMLDIPKDRVEELTALVKKHHPGSAEYHGVEPTIPAFP